MNTEVTAASPLALSGEAVAPPLKQGRVLLVAASLHVCNDAMFAVMYPLLPLIAADLGLSYGEVGLLKALYSGASAVLQLPAGLLGERLGEYVLLAFGNGWGAAGLLAMATAASFPVLLALAVLAGLGGNFQHPLASTMVARAFEGGRRGAAIGTLNFAGDLGKMAAPALVGLVALPFGWRAVLLGLGTFGLVYSVGVWLLRPWVRPPLLAGVATPSGGGKEGHAVPVSTADAARVPTAYWVLSLVGLLDASTRAAGLTFLPFALDRQGLDGAGIGMVFGVLFVGGALGKLVCGPLGDHLGPFAVVAVTESTTALALLGLVWGPAWGVLPLAVVFGFGLNGTSSVLYAAVAALVPDGKRGRGYGLYYTVIDAGAALATAVYGVLADWTSLDWAFALMSLLTLGIVPLALPIRARLQG